MRRLRRELGGGAREARRIQGHRRSLEEPGGAKEEPGGARDARRIPGGAKEETGEPKRSQEDRRRTGEVGGQEEVGGTKEEPGGQEEVGGTRRSQGGREEPGGSPRRWSSCPPLPDPPGPLNSFEKGSERAPGSPGLL